MANLKDLIVNGAARVIGKLYASEFVGNLTGNVTGNVSGSSESCTGNAATATKLGTSTIGGAKTPIYLNAGTPTAGTALGGAAYYGATSSIASESGDLVTSGAVYTALSGKANSSHGTHVSGTTFISGNQSNGEHDANNVTCNAIGYYTSNGPATSIGASTADGALYSQAYSTSWVAQIAQDYRDGDLFVRGKNNGTWQSWKKVWVSGDAVTGAVWNDLIDCIDVSEGDVLEPGYCYCMHEDGHYHKSETYLDSRFIGIDSDTYSLAMGMEVDKRKLNAAVAGFVLAYVDKEYPTGTALTCTENGYLTEIKKEDKCYNPEMIIAKYWKNEEREEIVREDKTVRVNGRKWVKIV